MIESEAVAVGSGIKVTVSRDELVQKLAVVARAVSARTTVLVLGGILLRAENGELHLAATDMELSLRTSLEAQVDGEGAVVVPGKMLVDLVRLLPDEDVEIEHRPDEGVVRVESGTYSSRLHTYNADDFPRLPEIEAIGTFQVDKEALLDTVGRVSRSASRDESRPVLTGILARFEGGKLVMAATDSYRLSVKETQLDEPLDGSLEANVPARTLQELGRIAGSADAIGVAALENQVVFTVDDVVLSSRLVEGRFPNYQQLLPESYEHELRVSRDELLEVVRRVGLLAQKNAPLRLRFSEGTLDVSAQTPDVGEASEALPVPFQGEPLEIGFNPEFFREGLESAESEELILKLISPLRPGLIQSGDEGGFIYLVMPIRLNV
jgi:DNA polymerase-3 subunit beta